MVVVACARQRGAGVVRPPTMEEAMDTTLTLLLLTHILIILQPQQQTHRRQPSSILNHSKPFTLSCPNTIFQTLHRLIIYLLLLPCLPVTRLIAVAGARSRDIIRPSGSRQPLHRQLNTHHRNASLREQVLAAAQHLHIHHLASSRHLQPAITWLAVPRRVKGRGRLSPSPCTREMRMMSSSPKAAIR